MRQNFAANSADRSIVLPASILTDQRRRKIPRSVQDAKNADLVGRHTVQDDVMAHHERADVAAQFRTGRRTQRVMGKAPDRRPDAMDKPVCNDFVVLGDQRDYFEEIVVRSRA